MSNKLTRKGLAFAALVALGSTLFAAAPSVADENGPLTLLPDGGTRDGATYTSLIGAGITLSSDLDSNLQSIADFEPLALDANGVSLAEYQEAALQTAGDGDVDDNGVVDTLDRYNAYSRHLNPVAFPGSWTADASITAQYDVAGAFVAAVDPLADAWYVVTNPSGADLDIDINSNDLGYYIYNGAGNAGGNGSTAGANFVVGEFGDEDYSIAARTGFTADANAAALIDAGMQEDLYVDVTEDGSNFFETNAKKIAIYAASGSTAGSRSVANIFIDAADSDQDDEIELTVTVLTDTASGTSSTTGTVNNGEYKSATQTVTLLDPASVSVTTTMDATTTDRGEDDLTAKVVIGNSVNPYAVEASEDLGVVFYRNGVDMDMHSDDGTVDIATDLGAEYIEAISSDWDTIEEDGLVFTDDWDESNLDSAVYSARAVWVGTDPDQYAGARSQVLDLRDGTNGDVDGIYAEVADSDDVAWDSANVLENAVADVVDVRTGTTDVGLALQILDGTEDLDDAGVRVRVTVSADSLDEDSEVTVGATKLSDGDDVTYYAYTGGDGRVNVAMTNAGAADGDTVTVSYAVLNNLGIYVVDGDDVTFTWQDAALESEFEVSPSGILAGDTINVTFTAVDQWGVGMDSTEDGRISFKVEAVVDGVVDTAEYSETEPTTNGAASFSFENFAAEGSNQEIIVYLVQATEEGIGEYITIYNNLATNSIVMADQFDTDVQYVDYVTGDASKSAVAAAAADVLALYGADEGEEYALISGTVLDANNAGQPGAAVTIAAAGVLFYDVDDTDMIAQDSITVYANAQGYFDVKAIAKTVNTTGHTVTVTADGKSTTTLLKAYLMDAIDSENLKFNWTLPANFVKDTTYSVALTLTDVNGNPVRTAAIDDEGNGFDVDAVEVSAAGSIQVNGVDAVTRNFGINGVATVFVRSVADIAGPGSLTAALGDEFNYYTGRSSGDYGDVITAGETHLDNADTSWDESLWAGAISVDVDVLDQAPVAEGKVNAGSFNGYVAVYAKGYEGATLSWKIAGKWFKTTVTSDYQVFQRKTIDVGATVNVELYINGVKQLTKSVVTR